MTIEEEVGDIVSKALKVKCEFRNVSDYGHVSTDYIYPLPQVGDVMHFQLEDNDWQVVSRRHFIGFELNEEYYKKACERIWNEQRQLKLF